MTNRSMPAKVKARIVELYRAGWGGSRIQKETGVSPRTVLRVVAQAGVPVRHGPRLRIDEKTQDEIVRLYEQGLSLRRIARRLGLSEAGVRGILSRKHLRPRKPVDFDSLPIEVRMPPPLRKTLAELYRQGLGINQIGKRLGLSTKSVREALRVEDVSQVRELSEQGFSLKKIASTLGVTPGMVGYIVHRDGIPRKPKGAGWYLSDDMRREILSLHQQRTSNAAIARQFHIHPITVANVLRRLGVPAHDRCDHAQILKLYRQGLGGGRIRQLLGVSETTVHKVARDAGILRRVPPRIKPEVETEVVRLYLEERVSCTQLAKRLGISTVSVSRILNRKGVVKTRRWPVRKYFIDPDRVRQFRAEGLSWSSILKRLGFPRTALSSVLRAAQKSPSTPEGSRRGDS